MTVEEGDLLYALVRMTKPKLAIETGTGHAIATKRIGQALRDNREGFLLSCDTEPEYVRDAKTATKGLPVDIRCTTGLVTLERFDGQRSEFIFIDAGNSDNRLKELKLVIDKEILTKNGLLILHDALNPRYEALVRYARTYFQYLIFESLAGIAVFQKR